MKKAAFLGIILIFVNYAAGWHGVEQKSDPHRLQGSWSGVEVNGPEGTCRFMVDGDQIHYVGNYPGEWLKASFQLDTAANPNRITVEVLEAELSSFVGATFTMIYKLEGDRLTVAGYHPMSGAIPDSFELVDGVRVIEFQRD